MERHATLAVVLLALVSAATSQQLQPLQLLRPQTIQQFQRLQQPQQTTRPIGPARTATPVAAAPPAPIPPQAFAPVFPSDFPPASAPAAVAAAPPAPVPPQAFAPVFPNDAAPVAFAPAPVSVPVSAPAGPAAIIPVLRRTEVHDDAGQFALGFETGNGIIASEQGALKKNVDGEYKDDFVLVKRGSYSYPGPDGRTYRLTYTADENGFHPTADYLPVAPFPVPAN